MVRDFSGNFTEDFADLSSLFDQSRPTSFFSTPLIYAYVAEIKEMHEPDTLKLNIFRKTETP